MKQQALKNEEHMAFTIKGEHFYHLHLMRQIKEAVKEWLEHPCPQTNKNLHEALNELSDLFPKSRKVKCFTDDLRLATALKNEDEREGYMERISPRVNAFLEWRPKIRTA